MLHLWDVIQQGFVESLHCVSVHLHTVGDELNEVRDGVVSDVTPRLQWPNCILTNRSNTNNSSAFENRIRAAVRVNKLISSSCQSMDHSEASSLNSSYESLHVY